MGAKVDSLALTFSNAESRERQKEAPMNKTARPGEG